MQYDFRRFQCQRRWRFAPRFFIEGRWSVSDQFALATEKPRSQIICGLTGTLLRKFLKTVEEVHRSVNWDQTGTPTGSWRKLKHVDFEEWI
ncbi:MAG TPA: hypothetical protein DGU45_06525 [Planctomycetes bacterium]|nr:hypothetical protein [Planctomycetota bacterium]